MKRADTYSGFTVAQQGFIDFLKKSHPRLYRVAMQKAAKVVGAQSLSGMGDIDWGNLFTNITDAVSKAAPAVLQLKQQKDLMKVQLQRAKAGQPPIDPGTYAQYATPSTAVSAEAPYSGFNVQTYAGGLPMSKILTFGGIALAGIAALYFLTKKR